MKQLTIKSLSIESCGPFKFAQTIDLSTSPGKPVVLIEGMNGSGKTTFLQSLQIVLFGNRLFSSFRKSDYDKLITDIIRKEPEANPSISADIEFSDEEETNNYRVIRRWTTKKNKNQEFLVVWKNGIVTDIDQTQWDALIDQYLPVELSDMFFFDGEKIEKMADPDNMPVILKKATETLLGVGEIDTLMTDTIAYERRMLGKMKSNKKINSEDLSDLEKKEKDLEKLNSDLERLQINLGEADRHLEIAKKEHDDFKERANKMGLSAFERATEMTVRQEFLRNDLNKLYSERLDLIANPLYPLLFIPNLIENLFARSEAERAGEEALLLKKNISAHDERLLSAVLSLFPNQSEQIKEIFTNEEALIKKMLPKEQAHLLEMPSKEIIYKEIQDIKSKKQHLQTQIIDLEEKILSCQKIIAETPHEEKIHLLLNELNEKYEEVIRHENRYASLKTEQETLIGKQRNAIQSLNSLRERLKTEIRGEAKQQAALRAASRVKEVLQVYKDRLLAQKAKKLTELITLHFRSLMHKQGLIKQVHVEPETFKITLQMESGEILPVLRLSAGERQLLSTALLQSLIGEKNTGIPVVVDTPLARLDTLNRQNLVDNFYTQVSHQVIVLSTDEEITGKIKESLINWTSREYNFIFNQELQSSQMHQIK